MAKKPDPRDHAPTSLNRQARYEYAFLDTWTAGVMLTGSEVKAAREGQVQLTDAFCAFGGQGGQELLLLNATINPYRHGAYANHEAKRPRKLLLNRKELDRIRAALTEKGLTVVPTKLFFNERGLVKVEIVLAKGKKQFDKRESIKARDTDRALRRGED